MLLQSALEDLRTSWRSARPDKHFPSFDHRVTRWPHTLVFLESPGPEVANSGEVSAFNDDGTAAELRRLLSIAFEPKEQAGVLCWNAIPWFLNRNPRISDVTAAKNLHAELLALVRPNLQYVLLLGAKARALLPFCSPYVGTARIYGGHHPGRQAQIQKGLVAENEAVFALIRGQRSEPV